MVEININHFLVYYKKVYEPISNELIAVINLNYMFPLPKYMYQELKYKEIDKHRMFINDNEKSKYIDLMKKELKIINSMNLKKSALKLYNNKYIKPNSLLAQRCIDFHYLERLAADYKTVTLSDLS